MSTNPSVRAAAGDPDAATLDATALAKLRALDPGGQAGIVARVLSTFDASMVKLIARFDAARAGSDLAAVQHVAHTLRSSAASVGALDLARCCTEVELRLREQCLEGLDPLLDSMDRECRRALAAVRAMLSREGLTT
jgi:hypothetical protein